ncbi:hypothetical protein MKW98_019755 [Papaver atlanticum]|uniref:Uncharacterized protein n=1 Tax=Papaver atlanticum TaxID=357466 RepID=A0AAD4TFA4_9MAGN|nr:hypothetical protein MKW98_019755 [Papaver atlanticum]
MKAELFILFCGVEGLYGVHQTIHNQEKLHLGEFRMGQGHRGGMTAKVKTVVYTASAGIPVNITRSKV